MAINYTAAYKYDAKVEKINDYIKRADSKFQDKKYNGVYYPTALKVYKSLCAGNCNNANSWGGLYNPKGGQIVAHEITTPCLLGFNAISLDGFDNYKFYPMISAPSYVEGFGFANIPTSLAMLKSEGFDTIITGCQLFDNSNDGNYSDTKPRAEYNNNYGAGLYLTSPSQRRFLNGSPQDYSSGYEYIMDLRIFGKCYTPAKYIPRIPIDYFSWQTFLMFDEIVRCVACVNSDCTPNVNSTYGIIESWNNRTSGFSGFIVNLKKFKSFVKLFGIPFTFDPAAKYTNIDDLPDYVPPGQPTNPTDGGGGDGDNESDDMELPDVQVSPTNTFSRLSCCTISELNELSNFLFTSTFYDNIKLLTNNPLESLCTVMYYPFDVLNHSTCGVAHNLTLTNVSTPATVYDLDVSYNMYLDMGHIDVNPYYGSYLDYSPNTEIELYLPYRGFVNLPTNDIIGRQLSVKYMIDFYSGNATILVFADTKLVHVSNAQVGINIPISQSNANSRAISLTTAAVGAVGAIAGGAIGGAAGGLAGAAIGAGQAAGANAIPTANRIFNAAQNHVDKGGSFGGVGWLYAPQVCSLIFNRPILAEPTAYKTMNGYSTSFSGLVSSYSGFLQADSISGTTGATDEENNMIFNLLRNGIYV